MNLYSLYLHIPFCRHRCAYCDFNTYAGMEALISDYTYALCREIAHAAEHFPPDAGVHTLFFGGGTPSLLPLADLAQILHTARAGFLFTDDCEITLEANPGTVSLDYLRGLRAMGINRLSMGMQSADPGDLRVLERIHDFFDVVNAVKWARQAGFTNLNLDLIFGLPYQTLASWQKTLDLAVGLNPEHLSVYSLILEHGTPMNAWVERGLLTEPDDDLAASMYEWAMERLPQSGYAQYEISNWAKREATGHVMACRHNLQYWYNQPYLGLGAGAHGFAGGVRTANVRAPRAYVERFGESTNQQIGKSANQQTNKSANQQINQPTNQPSKPANPPAFPRTPATVNATPIERFTEMQETMMVGLRLVEEGVNLPGFAARFGERAEAVFAKELGELVERGLLEVGEERVRLTARGRMMGNQVFMQFV
ncbi:MAG: radical SAM family heme chaperone HemW [Anaerolineales bacterium]|nr:radical SAM family heme chaperone HemW [Anaerolineales bacterium]